MTLIEFGNVLREERVRCGYTVDEVASRLKITSRMVRAIEDGDMESMPHAVYARGFIRAYGRLLDIDEEEVRLVCMELRDAEEEQNAPELVSQPRSGRGLPLGCLVRILIICLVLGGIWMFREALPFEGVKIWVTDMLGQSDTSEERIQDEPTPQPQSFTIPSSNSSAVESTMSSASLESPIATDATQGAQSQKNVNEFRSESTPVTTSGFASPSTPADRGENLTLQTSTGGTPLVADPAQQKHQVIITAIAECWVHSTADGTDTRQLSIKTGEVFSLSFDRKLVVKLGNAGGVRIKYDGKELPPPGSMGQVRTVTFPPQENN